MKNSVRLLLTIVALGSATLLGPRLTLQPAFAAIDPPPTRLQAAMRTLGMNMNVLKTQLPDASKNASTIGAVNKMIEAVSLSKQETPPSLIDVPFDQQADFLAKYNQALTELEQDLTQIRELLGQNRNAEAIAVKDSIISLMQRAHGMFM